MSIIRFVMRDVKDKKPEQRRRIDMTQRGKSFLFKCEGASAVEFALISPAIILMLFGIVTLSMMLSTYSALQQIAAEAVRAALAGTSTAQETQFANQYVSGVVSNYSFIDPTKLVVTTNASANSFQVTLTYDASASYFAALGASSLATPLTIVRSASVQVAGF